MVRVGSTSATSHGGQAEEIRMALIVVQDMTTATMQVGHTNFSLASTVTVRTLLEHIATSTSYMMGTFQLQLQPSGFDKSMVVYLFNVLCNILENHYHIFLCRLT